MQQVDVEFFGLAIRETTHKKITWSYKNGYKKTEHPEKPLWYCYFVLDLGKRTKGPILFWSRYYESKPTIEKMKAICENAGLALLNNKKTGVGGKLSNAEKVVTELKMKFFGSKDIPIKIINDWEWEQKYSKVTNNQNKVIDI